jgi:cytidylate kinase
MAVQVIVAIDGPSGAGKSTVGKMLARELGYIYIDTGAMYRALGWKAVKEGVALKEGPELKDFCAHTDVTLRQDGGELRVYVDGEDVSPYIRTPEMSMAASAISAQPSVRARLLELQRQMGRGGGVVLEGRDIGTVVFPEAKAKFYLDADPVQRAERRYAELKAKGDDVSLERIIEEVKKRDYDDSHRAIAPLKKADDAVVVDSSRMSAEEVVSFMKAKIKEVACGVDG